MKLASIVEGHGEVEALPVVLRRLLPRLVPDRYIDVTKPFRLPRGKIVNRPEELARALQFCSLKADATLIVLDSDDDAPCALGPKLHARANDTSQTTVGVVLAETEFESWFLASAPSLEGHIGLPRLEAPDDASAIRDAKGWIAAHLPLRATYKEILHQPSLAAVFDLDMARRNAPSFDKLCRECVRLCQ